MNETSVKRYFAFLEQCEAAKACTILLRGGSKDVLNEVERNLQDAMQVCQFVLVNLRLRIHVAVCLRVCVGGGVKGLLLPPPRVFNLMRL